MKAFALVCSLNPSPTPSSSDLIARHVLAELEKHDVETSRERVVDYNVTPGVATDMGDGDEWPALRQKVLDADIFVLATPIWMGHPASIAQKVLERLNAESSETDEYGRPILYNKTALVAVVGNEDGAHKVTADTMQGLNDVGFTLPAQGGTYWVGEAMQNVDYRDLEEIPEMVATTTANAARNAVHVARLLRSSGYPA